MAGVTGSIPEHGRWAALRLRLVIRFGVILALVGAGCGGGPLGAKALLQESKSLRSEAAEGALLAQDMVSGKTTRIYAREYASDLSGAASQAQAFLSAAKTGSRLEPTLRRLAILAGQVSVDLESLGSASKDGARVLARELRAAAEASQQIGEALT
jgi:hypothetical protein